MLNDVSASLAAIAAEADAAFIAMHMRATPADMQDNTNYEDVVAEVFAFLRTRADEARALGLSEVYVDPGIGFAKTAEQNLELLKTLPALVGQGSPVAVGTSRKSFLGKVLAAPGEPPLPLEERAEASLATAVWAMAAGAAIVRVHDVEATAQAARLLRTPVDAASAVAEVGSR
jgi:dihydropteroate synthase